MSRTLALFGITGRTGQALASRAADSGWIIRGLMRLGAEFPVRTPGITIVNGELTEYARVAETVAGSDVVCVLFGPRPPYLDPFCAAGTSAIVRAMRESGCGRIIALTGAMVGTATNRTAPFSRLARMYAGRQPVSAADRIEQERVVGESGLDWTIIKPPRLTNGPARGRVQSGPSLSVGLLSRISRQDLAGFILQEIESPRYSCRRVFVKG